MYRYFADVVSVPHITGDADMGSVLAAAAISLAVSAISAILIHILNKKK